jgi:4-amino-4-deoxy-L-arabinose transferase-like glycosyltransferase
MSKIFKRISAWQWLLGIITLSLTMFFPAFRTFFTNDDFYQFVVSRAGSLKDFLNFFNLVTPATGFPNYRPLSILVPYFLDWKLFSLNPLFLHLLSFVLFSAVVVLVYRLVKMLTRSDKIAILATFLYATSASHFGHLYIASPTETGYTLFALLSMILFIGYYSKREIKSYLLSIVCFVLALMSKETAVITPPLLLVIYIYLRLQNNKKLQLKKAVLLLIPYASLLAGYLYLRFFHYGLAQGDSYVWDFSPTRALNSLFWYVAWSFNLPEMLVDFVGPGLALNSNLMKYYSKEIIPIFILFGAQVILLVYGLTKIVLKKGRGLICFSVIWFILTLIPVLFLPVHKFTFYLTLPLIGFVIPMSYLLTLPGVPQKIVIIFASVWLATSVMTLGLTRKTNWVTRGAQVAENVLRYFESNEQKYDGKTILFYDTEDDKGLPFSPTATLKNALSDDNFFKVFFDGSISPRYEGETGFRDWEKVKSRQFLGY